MKTILQTLQCHKNIQNSTSFVRFRTKNISHISNNYQLPMRENGLNLGNTWCSYGTGDSVHPFSFVTPEKSPYRIVVQATATSSHIP